MRDEEGGVSEVSYRFRSGSGSGTGSVENITDPQHCFKPPLDVLFSYYSKC